MKLLTTKKITIGDKEYSLRMSVRVMINYEELTGHPASEMVTLKDVVAMFYCTLKAGGTDITYDQFLDLIDDEPGAIKSFKDLMVEPVEKKKSVR